jgi:hypothetical protein
LNLTAQWAQNEQPMGLIGILKAEFYLTEGMMLVNYPFLPQHFNLETVFPR